MRLNCLATAVIGLAFLPLTANHVRAQIALDMVHAEVAVRLVEERAFGKQVVSTFESNSPPGEYNGIVLQGFSLSNEISGSVRFRSEGQWSDWQPLYIVRSATDGAYLAGYYSDNYRILQQIEVRFVTDDDRAPYIVASGIFDSRRDDDRDTEGVRLLRKTGQTSIERSDVVPPALITRREWNAEPFIGTPVPLANPRYTNMTFHHAAGFRATTLQEGLQQVKSIQDFHQNGRGWSDIGYQFVVDRGGRVYQGRPFLDDATTLEDVPLLARGAHVGELNTGNIGICLLGCYHPPEGPNCQDSAPTVAVDTYISMFAFLGDSYGIPINSTTVKGHRDFSATACPGDNNYALLPELRDQANQLILFGNETPTDFALEQNAPNPFSTTTTIRYFVETDGVVNLAIYDLTGREVATLVNDFNEGSRWYRTNFDATHLPSGLYFYQLRVDGFAGEIHKSSRTLTHVK